MRKGILKIYSPLFLLVAEKRLKEKDLPERYIHAHLVSVLSTGILMWAYALLALFTIDSPIPGIVGITASSIHLLSPFLYRTNNHYFANTNVFIACGIIHQMTFAYFTGGFDSNILIWLGILPMLAGLVAGRRGALLWSLITSLSVLAFLALRVNGFKFPFLISPMGHLISQGLILFGWIFIATSVIWVHLFLVEQNAEKLESSKERTQNLINILSHDISTPLSVIGIKLNHLMKTKLDEDQANSAGKAYRAAERVLQITESLKELRLTELGKKEITYSRIDIKGMILEMKDIYKDRLEQKDLRFIWSVSSEVYEFYSSRSLLMNQILGNLLSNAIKFSSSDNEIRLRVSRKDNFIQFVLEDSGRGIPKDMRDNIFLANLSRSTNGTEGEVGTGFGLPIAKSCMDRLGGTIVFETKTANEGPSGTRFKLLFPV